MYFVIVGQSHRLLPAAEHHSRVSAVGNDDMGGADDRHCGSGADVAGGNRLAPGLAAAEPAGLPRHLVVYPLEATAKNLLPELRDVQPLPRFL